MFGIPQDLSLNDLHVLRWQLVSSHALFAGRSIRSPRHQGNRDRVLSFDARFILGCPMFQRNRRTRFVAEAGFEPVQSIYIHEPSNDQRPINSASSIGSRCEWSDLWNGRNRSSHSRFKEWYSYQHQRRVHEAVHHNWVQLDANAPSALRVVS